MYVKLEVLVAHLLFNVEILQSGFGFCCEDLDCYSVQPKETNDNMLLHARQLYRYYFFVYESND